MRLGQARPRVIEEEPGEVLLRMPGFPCGDLQELDRRHVQDDRISLVGNLSRIQSVGVEAWLVQQEQAWSCPSWGGNVCVMGRVCYDCGVVVR
jgi:hypothetical protein